MATVTRYVDTASTAGGDGTTQAHSGTTRAYASLSEWEANEQTDLPTDGDTHEVYCAGSTADGTGVVVAGWTTGSGNEILISGDRSAPDSDGFYDGNLSWSTSHYRLQAGSTTVPLEIQIDYVTVDGIQVWQTDGGANREGVTVSNCAETTVRNCRVRMSGGGANFAAISLDNGPNYVHNNLVFEAGRGIRINPGLGTGYHQYIYNNTVWDCGTGIHLDNGSSGATQNIINNCVFDNTTDMALDITPDSAQYNAGEDDPPTGETNGVTLSGTLTDDMEDPQATAGSEDVRPVASGALDGAGLGSGTDSNVPTTDILGNSRDSSTPSIGAFELQSSGQSASGTLASGASSMSGSAAVQRAASGAINAGGASMVGAAAVERDVAGAVAAQLAAIVGAAKAQKDVSGAPAAQASSMSGSASISGSLDTGWVIAGTGSGDASYGSAGWSNTSNITADDDNVASSTSSSSPTHYLTATNFGFSIPSGATIDGIEVRVQARETPANMRFDRLRAIKGGTIQTTDGDSSESLTGTLTNYDFGSSSYLWGTTWAASDINASNFGVAVAFDSTLGVNSAQVDAIWIKIHYTPTTPNASGALAAGASAMAGEASKELDAAGALADGAATIVGAAVREPDAAGALAAQDASISGFASFMDATGDLIASAATITGAAVRKIVVSGTLQPDASSMTGLAALVKNVTGALAAGAAAMTGFISKYVVVWIGESATTATWTAEDSTSGGWTEEDSLSGGWTSEDEL